VGLLEGSGDRVGHSRNNDQVDVIRHQTIAEQGKLMPGKVLLEELPVDGAIGVGFEDESAVVTALRNVVRNVYGDDTGQPAY
jgi:hypothetical protein